MAGKIKGLQQWCQRMADGYRDVHIKDFTTSWRDGLAFCAIIHRFRPDLIDYDSLSKENVFDNNNLAFSVAEKELDIPAFLEAADMVALRTPDKLSVITYVSQYYNKLSPLPQLGGPGVQGKKTTAVAPAAHGVKRHQPAEPLSEPEPKKQPPAKKSEAASSGKVKTLGDRCAICNNKVYLLERHVEEGKLYHRSCFRHSDLSPSSKVYTRSPFLSPSLHGKDSGAVSPTGGRASPNISSKLHGGDETHGTKRPPDGGSRDTANKSEVRKFLFSKDDETKNKPEEKSALKDAGLGKNDYSKDKQAQPGRSGVASKLESKVVSAPQTQTHSSMDFLSAGTTAEDSKSPKRKQLPLIFQAAGSADNGASDKTSKGAGNKTSLFSQNKLDSTPNLSAKQAPNSANSVTIGKSLNDKSDKSSHSVFSGSDSRSVCSEGVTGKSPQQRTQPEKSVSESKVTEKSAGPVAKPRHIGAKVLPGASDLKQEKDKSSAFPKPRPRTAILSTETSEKPEKTKSPPALRKGPARPTSCPSRELSPPPLPASAPPPLPQSSIPHSSQHVPKPSSPEPSPRKQSTPVSSSLTSSSEEKAKSGFSLFGKKKASGGSSARHEEPMDVETAFKEARSQHGEEPVAVMVVPAANKEQEDKTALSGLLKSLAHVRNTGSPSTSTTMSSSSVTQPALSGAKTSSSHSSAASDNSSGSSSTKITLGHTKDGDHKSPLASGNKEKKSDESSGKSRFSLSFLKSGDTSHKDAEAQKNASKSSDTSSDKTVPVTKLGETVTITLNTKKTEESASKPVSILSKPEEKSTERVPLYKKKAESNPANRTNRLGDSPRGTPAKDISSRTGGAFGAKKDRPKSAADILGGKELSTPKLASAGTDSSQAPLFTQVKLRDSSQSALERKDRPKSAGILLDSGADSRPSWQQEAERKMAVYRDGFVDPETKKTVGKNMETDQAQGTRASPVEDGSAGKLDKSTKREPPPRPAPFHSPASETWQKEGKISLAKTTDVKKKSDESKAELGSTFKQDSSTPGTEQPSSAAHLKKKEEKSLFGGGLKGILKGKHTETPETTTTTAPPVKPERQLHNRQKQHPEAKPPAVAETLKGSDASASSKPAEESATKKKITVSLKDDHDQTVTPSPGEPSDGRKRITVDINFDFNMSSSMEASGQFTSPRAKEKATPPSRPPPPHRTSMSPGRLSAIELQKQLLDIDSKLSELELRGRTLEDSIRSVAAEEEDEELMMEWFQLVSEKNELVRKECDLVYMSREQDLEDEQSQIESQLRYLLTKEENDKSFEEKEEEEYLIQRKVQIVNQRNSIVDSIDEDRLRYEEEDRDIAQMLQIKGFMKDGSSPPQGKDKGKAADKRMLVGSSLFYT